MPASVLYTKRVSPDEVLFREWGLERYLAALRVVSRCLANAPFYPTDEDFAEILDYPESDAYALYAARGWLRDEENAGGSESK
jgi:hypothetical protein